MTRNHPNQVLVLLTVLALGFAGVAAAQDQASLQTAPAALVGAGDDALSTPATGNTHKTFEAVRVPAACGNDDGILDQDVLFEGRPLASSHPQAFGNTDTIVRRLDTTPALRVGETAEVNIQIKGLRLVSLSPARVSCPDGTTIDYNVSAHLSSLGQSVGTMVITRSHPDGGTFDSEVLVTPKFYFTRADGDAGRTAAIELDCGDAAVDCSLGSAAEQIRFSARDTPWTLAGGPGGYNPEEAGVLMLPPGVAFDSDGDGSFDSQTIGSGNMVPGVDPTHWDPVPFDEEAFRAQHQAEKAGKAPSS